MIATTHLLVGGAVGVAVGHVTQNPVLALAAGFSTHIICDAIPHIDHPWHEIGQGKIVWTPAVWTFAIADSLIGLIIIFLLWRELYGFPALSSFIWGAMGGYLPDFISNVPFWSDYSAKLPILKQWYYIHNWVHDLWQERFPPQNIRPFGTLIQLFLIILSLWYLLKP